jgi:hypothetical protein
MDPADARTPENLERARKQREEAVRQQSIRIAEQALQLKQQREKIELEKRALEATPENQGAQDVARARMEFEAEQAELRREDAEHPPPPPSQPIEPEIRPDAQGLGGAPSRNAASADEPLPTFKPLVESELICPNCHANIPSYRRGAFYTECAKCGAIIKGGSS